MAVRLAGNVWSLYKSGEMVKQAERELAEAKKQNEKLGNRWEEVQSEGFIEKEAREKLGLGKPGEVVVILPTPEKVQGSMFNVQEESNWRKWWELYVGI